MTAHAGLGTVDSLWRYPVKSMMGEDLDEAALTERGLPGDRAHAVVDSADGSIASAKKWPRLFEFRARLIDPPPPGTTGHPVRITLPGGETVTSDREDCGSVLSRTLGRDVALRSGGAFHDCATIHLLTTATLARLGELAARSRFDARRFRPNLVVRTASGLGGFLENDWIGHTLAIGDAVRLRVTEPCERCVMTTLPQDGLPGDPEILRTAAQHNQAHVGVYAAVLRGGVVRRGDAVTLAEP